MANPHIPFIVLVSNTSKDVKRVILFGSNRNYHKPNFGNDPEVVIENDAGNPENDYGQLLQQVKETPIKIAFLRISTTDMQNFIKKGKSIDFKITDANGCERSMSTSFKSIEEQNQYNFQENILAIQFPIETNPHGTIINSNVQIELQLEAQSSMTIQIWPKENE